MSTQTISWLCLASVIGGVLQFIAIGSELIFSVQVGDLLQLISFVFIVLGIPGLFAFLENSMGKFGKIAFFLTLVGSVMVVGVKWMRVFVQPVIEKHAPELMQVATPPSPLNEGFMISFALMSVGWTLWTIVMLKANVVSKWGPALLLAAMISNWIPGIGFILAIPMFALGFIWLSVSVWKGSQVGIKPVPIEPSIT